jgi:hypothetical protein
MGTEKTRMPQKPVTSKSHRTDFYKFFCHWARDNQAAAEAATAGLVAAALLTLTMLAGSAVSLLRGSWAGSHASVLCGIAVCSGLVFYGTLKQVTSAPIIGSLIGLGITGWLVMQHEVAIAAVVFVPFVCGFLTAARGLRVLNDHRRG